jgi:hypothetical protein
LTCFRPNLADTYDVALGIKPTARSADDYFFFAAVFFLAVFFTVFFAAGFAFAFAFFTILPS